jgi:hypothetical protein
MEPASPDHYTQAMTPYLKVMRSVVLPPRGKKGSPVNRLRAKIMQAALHQKKYPRGIGCHIREAKGRCGLCRVRVPRA